MHPGMPFRHRLTLLGWMNSSLFQSPYPLSLLQIDSLLDYTPWWCSVPDFEHPHRLAPASMRIRTANTAQHSGLVLGRVVKPYCRYWRLAGHTVTAFTL